MSNKKNFCPWYKDGYCISSMLDHPDNTVTGSHCFEEYKYKTCRFYKEPEQKQQAACPWYKDNNYCHSPKLSKPVPVYKDYCFGNYKYCPYFLPPKQSQLNDFNIQRPQQPGTPQIESPPAQKKSIKVTELIESFSRIYEIDAAPEHACEFISFTNYNGKILAYCDVLNRFLTKSIVPLCSTQFLKCPYRGMAE